jgi:hypothetical protein
MWLGASLSKTRSVPYSKESKSKLPFRGQNFLGLENRLINQRTVFY